MDIDINIGGADLYIYKIRYVRARRNQAVISLHDGLVEIGMFHETAVDKEIFVTTFLFGGLRFGCKTSNAAKSRLDGHWQQVLTIPASKDIRNTLAKGTTT